MADLRETPSQTAGPYVHIGCAPQAAGLEPRMIGPQLGKTSAEEGFVPISITVFDGEGNSATDALLEVWQTGPRGDHWGRQTTDAETGTALFHVPKPLSHGEQAPHLLIWIVARGINLGLTTRLYFPDEDNGQDNVLALAADRANTLIAQRDGTGYAHSIHLQGPNETVFFDV